MTEQEKEWSDSGAIQALLRIRLAITNMSEAAAGNPAGFLLADIATFIAKEENRYLKPQ